MANVKIVICADEASAKSIAAMLKRSTGGGYKTVDGPFKADSVLVETFGVKPNTTYEYSDDSDGEAWVVVGRMG